MGVPVIQENLVNEWGLPHGSRASHVGLATMHSLRHKYDSPQLAARMLHFCASWMVFCLLNVTVVLNVIGVISSKYQKAKAGRNTVMFYAL